MNSPYASNLRQRSATRRDFLWQLGGGLGGVALTTLLAEQSARAASPLHPFNQSARPQVRAIPCPRPRRHPDLLPRRPQPCGLVGLEAGVGEAHGQAL